MVLWFWFIGWGSNESLASGENLVIGESDCGAGAFFVGVEGRKSVAGDAGVYGLKMTLGIKLV